MSIEPYFLSDIAKDAPYSSQALEYARRGETELARSGRTICVLSLALMDVDQFSEFCDRSGKLVGEQVLKKVANPLIPGLRQYDVAARLDGETFGILFPDTEISDAITVTDRRQEAVACLSLPLESTRAQIGRTLSVGVACNVEGPISKLETLIQAANAALRRAKEAGNQVE